MKVLLNVIAIIMFASNVWSQGNFNIEQISHVPNDENLSDVWGYVSEDGTEYAIIGTTNATEIYSLSDPSAPVLVKRVPGSASIWRDIKSLGNFIYVVTDQNSSNDGVTIIDMTNAPEDITYTQSYPIVGTTTVQRCHNLYIDTATQVMFLAGCNGNNSPVSGITAYDITTDPNNPTLINTISTNYAHDVFVRDNLVFSSEIFSGILAIYDIMDIMNPVALGTTSTTSFFTHNAWSSDDNQYVYTTDEVPNGKLDAYDISDLNNPARVDVFEPKSIIGQGVVPHNTHFFNDFLVTSWYTYGLVITDVSQPDKIIEVGHFNTGENPDYWGAYPYLPSGLILASDIVNGLYVLQANYERASYLTGTITDAESGEAIFNATVKVLAEEPFGDNSDPNGKYTTGDLSEGTFMVEFNHPDYDKVTQEVTLTRGESVEINVTLNKSPVYNQVIKTIDAFSGLPVENVNIYLFKEGLDIYTITGNDGELSREIVSGEFGILTGKWGYKYTFEEITFSSDSIFVIELNPGYEDDFIFDYNWTSAAPNTRSDWVRADPIGTLYNGQESNPGSDVEGDFGDLCYVTGNGQGGAGAFDVDDGNSILISPVMDLSDAQEATLQFNPWFFNDGGSGIPPNDTFKIFVNNGDEKKLLASISENTGGWGETMYFKLKNFITLNDQIQIIFEAGDHIDSGHLVEAGVDAFKVDLDGSILSNNDSDYESQWMLFPNPVTQTINLRNSQSNDMVGYSILNSEGQMISEGIIRSEKASIQAPSIPGFYVIQLKSSNNNVENIRFVVLKK